MNGCRHQWSVRSAITSLMVSSLVYAGSLAASEGPLTGQEIRDLIVGNTVIGPINARQYDFSYKSDGGVYGDIGVSGDRGSYTISDDGVYCHEWFRHFDATRRCYQWYRAQSGRYVLRNIDTYRVRNIDVWRIKPGLQ